jgi:hypothetical protein
VRAKRPHVRVTEDPLRNDLVPRNIGGLSSALRLQQVEIHSTPPPPPPPVCSCHWFLHILQKYIVHSTCLTLKENSFFAKATDQHRKNKQIRQLIAKVEGDELIQVRQPHVRFFRKKMREVKASATKILLEFPSFPSFPSSFAFLRAPKGDQSY